MKRTKRTCLTRILVLVLVVAMLTPTTLAAGSGFGLSSWFQGVWDRFVGWFQPVQPEVPEEPEVPAAELTVVESPDTVDNGDALRASTYAVNNAAEIEAAGGRAVQNIRYFDVTLFDYDTDTINDKTHELEYEANSNLTEWAGLYFNNGYPEAAKYPSNADDYAEVRIQSTETDLDQYCNSVYYYYHRSFFGGRYELVTSLSYSNRRWIINGEYREGDSTLTLYRSTTLPFADYNFWTGKLSNEDGNRIYSGLANNTLVNNEISLSVVEPGIFTMDEFAGKTVY